MKPKMVGAARGGTPAKRPIEGNTGMAAGTPVLTLDGELPIEFLSVGDRVITRAGTARVTDIHVTEITLRPYMVVSGTLGQDRPDQDILLAPGQKILLRDWRAKALFDADQAKVPVDRIADGSYIAKQPEQSLRLFTLRFDSDQVIFAGGLELVAETSVPVAA